MIECPDCEGEKTITIHDARPSSLNASGYYGQDVEVDCETCNGRGWIEDEEA